MNRNIFFSKFVPFRNFWELMLHLEIQTRKKLFSISKNFNKLALITKRVRDNFATRVVIIRIVSPITVSWQKEIKFSFGVPRQLFYNWILNFTRVFYILFKKCLTEGTYYCSKKNTCHFLKIFCLFHKHEKYRNYIVVNTSF